MSYRVWPAGLLTSAALAAACVVVGGHVVETGDGCLGSDSFIGTPANWLSGPLAGPEGKPVPEKAGMGMPAIVDPIGESNEVPPSPDLRITGCLDVDRIESPAPTPITDGRA